MSRTKIFIGERPMTTSGDDAQKNDRVISIPTWVVDLVKFLTPAIVVLAAMYFRVENLNTEVVRLRSDADCKGEQLITLERRVEVMAVTNNEGTKAVTATLTRIENDIKVIQADVKEIQRAQVASAGKPRPKDME